MCDLTCEAGDLHQMECQLLTEADFEADVECEDKVDDHYAAILPLRCVSLCNNDPESWRVYKSFLSHCKDRKMSNPDLWNYQKEHSVDFVR